MYTYNSARLWFQKISNETINNYQVNNFKLEGDRKIGSQLKNEIFVNSKKNSENLLSIKMEVNKKKDIKERNSSNQVTKYSITIGVDLIKIIFQIKREKRSFSKSQDYKVEDTYSQTLKNERKVLEDLNKRLSRDIINFIIFEKLIMEIKSYLALRNIQLLKSKSILVYGENKGLIDSFKNLFKKI